LCEFVGSVSFSEVKAKTGLHILCPHILGKREEQPRLAFRIKKIKRKVYMSASYELTLMPTVFPENDVTKECDGSLLPHFIPQFLSLFLSFLILIIRLSSLY